MNDQTVYELNKLDKTISTPSEDLTILTDVSLRVRSGESLAVVGASGSGKTTLLHLMGGLDTPSGGEILFMGRDLNQLSWKELAEFRNRTVGFVFQFHHLLPEFNAAENVAMPALISGGNRRNALSKAGELLELVGLAGRSEQQVMTLSGGERQRVAVARALMQDPEVILADEPTGNLDDRNGALVADLLAHVNTSFGTTLVLVTHNLELAELMNRKIFLRSGRLYDAP
jgi:lipoprotein-releasing system ATP-binding protein